MKFAFHSPPNRRSANKVSKVKCNYTTYMQKKKKKKKKKESVYNNIYNLSRGHEPRSPVRKRVY